MGSNIAQNYPYSSETEAQRAAAVSAALAAFDGVAQRVSVEASPLPAQRDARWWVWVCPEDDFKGRLHVAGYGFENHAVYTVCDTCGRTFLR